MKKLILLFILLMPVSFCLYAQEETGTIIATPDPDAAPDTVTVTPAVEPQAPRVRREIKPKVATLLSTAVPGLGQAYVGSYWKIPIIYAAEGALIYLIHYNNKNYHQFREAYNIRTDTLPSTTDQFADDPNYSSEDDLRLARNDYKRNRDLSIIVAILVYGLQILDANVDAHLQGFKINDELSLNVKPFYYNNNPTTFGTSGLTFALKFE